ncbi:hypothetical protein BSL78_00507 [Apostichopus japonicus]|uniref:Uncharacterized protein n=1 Tax=Stichopus japonicus TaxID=307972 RepID=A0A2G8LQV4_STIJA|nr:hypothetical protein BSL78_00507 [Apostichopus japonicus]
MYIHEPLLKIDSFTTTRKSCVCVGITDIPTPWKYTVQTKALHCSTYRYTGLLSTPANENLFYHGSELTEARKRKIQEFEEPYFTGKEKVAESSKAKVEATRIHLGNQVERWTELKEKLGLKNDTEVARYLLDSLSFDYTDVGDYIIPHDTPGSIDRDSDPDWDSGEEDADSSDMSVDLNVSHPEQPADLDLDTILSFAETDQSEDEDVDDGTGSEACAEDTLFITYKESLLQLLKDCRPKSCVRESCQSPPQEVTKFVGTAVGVKWICAHGHVSKIWHSQPKLKGNNAGE